MDPTRLEAQGGRAMKCWACLCRACMLAVERAVERAPCWAVQEEACWPPKALARHPLSRYAVPAIHYPAVTLWMRSSIRLCRNTLAAGASNHMWPAVIVTQTPPAVIVTQTPPAVIVTQTPPAVICNSDTSPAGHRHSIRRVICFLPFCLQAHLRCAPLERPR